MKVRLQGDSIRLRLGPTEVAQLVGTGSVTGQTHVGPDAALGYSLALAETDAVTATFAAGHLRVAVPAPQARRWAASTRQVEIRADQPAGDGRRLSILIEKDFACLHGEEPDPDVFPHPAAGQAGA